MGQEERPPNEAETARREQERAQSEQDLRGPAQVEQARRERLAEEERRRQEPEKRQRLSGDDANRELARFIQQNAVFQSGTSQDELDRIRIAMGDEKHEAHVALRNYHRALANHRGHPGTPAGNIALEQEINESRKAVEGNPLAKARLEKLERARRRNEPVDLTEED